MAVPVALMLELARLELLTVTLLPLKRPPVRLPLVKVKVLLLVRLLEVNPTFCNVTELPTRLVELAVKLPLEFSNREPAAVRLLEVMVPLPPTFTWPAWTLDEVRLTPPARLTLLGACTVVLESTNGPLPKRAILLLELTRLLLKLADPVLVLDSPMLATSSPASSR